MKAVDISTYHSDGKVNVAKLVSVFYNYAVWKIAKVITRAITHWSHDIRLLGDLNVVTRFPSLKHVFAFHGKTASICGPCTAFLKSRNNTLLRSWRISGRQIGGCQGCCRTSEVRLCWEAQVFMALSPDPHERLPFLQDSLTVWARGGVAAKNVSMGTGGI